MSSNFCTMLPPSLRHQSSNSALSTTEARLRKKIIQKHIIFDDCQQKRKQLPLPPRVTFATTASVRDHLHVNNISEEEIRAAWMSSSERKSIKDDATKAIRILEQGTFLGDEEFCGRGLECLVDPQWIFRRNRGIEVVMKTQKTLQHLDDPNPAMMAQVYRMVTAESRIFAHAKALSDCEAARN
jgi:hypothetical protein